MTFQPKHFYLIVSDKPLTLEGEAYCPLGFTLVPQSDGKRSALEALRKIAAELEANFTVSEVGPDDWETWNATEEEAATVVDYVEAVWESIIYNFYSEEG